MAASTDGFVFRNAELHGSGYLSSHVDRMVIDGRAKGTIQLCAEEPEDAGDHPVVKSESSHRPAISWFVRRRG